MLETVKKYSNRNSKITLNEIFTRYLLEVQNVSIQLEFKYLLSHNKLDVLKLNKLINEGLKSVIDR